MTIKRDSSNPLDAAIDQVTARLVRVREDDEFAARVVRALPERSSRLGWLVPQVAAVTALAIAAGVWMLRDTSPPSVSPLPAEAVAVMGGPNMVVAVAPGTALRTRPLELLEPLETLEPLDDGSDHERSLPAIEAVTALVVSDLLLSELPATPALALEPIAIVDLPLTAETFPR